MGVPHKNKHLTSPMSTCMARPVMFRSNKVNRLLNPKSKNTDQLGLCGVVYKVTPYFPSDQARQVQVIPRVDE
jgi:hypothetical protein